MITVTNRAELLRPGATTALFVGADHGADVSFFWVDAAPGTGPERHFHPYTETWVVLGGQADVEAGDERVLAVAGDVVTVTAGTVHRFRAAGEGRLAMVCIHASPVLIQDFVDDAD